MRLIDWLTLILVSILVAIAVGYAVGSIIVWYAIITAFA